MGIHFLFQVMEQSTKANNKINSLQLNDDFQIEKFDHFGSY